MDSLIAPNALRTLIRAHAADALKEARLHGGFIGFERRVVLFGSFLREHPDHDLGFAGEAPQPRDQREVVGDGLAEPETWVE